MDSSKGKKARPKELGKKSNPKIVTKVPRAPQQKLAIVVSKEREVVAASVKPKSSHPRIGAVPPSIAPKAASRPSGPQPQRVVPIRPSEVTVTPTEGRELLYYGKHICKVLASKRRDDIIRVYLTEESLGEFASLLRWCAQNRRAYHVIPADEMERVTHSVHHEGIALLARTASLGSTDELLAYLETHPSLPLLIVDGVQNPHNLGTIMRVMASFGWAALIGTDELPCLSAASARMSEGGAEFVRSFKSPDLKEFISELKKRGYRVMGTSSYAKASIYEAELPQKMAWVVGSEVFGMSPSIRALLDAECVIPHSGQVESLNVSVACGLLLGEHARRHGLGEGEMKKG